MTWVAWRLHRVEGAVVLAVLAVLGAFLLLTGLPMAHSYQQSGLAACLAHATDSTVRSVCGQVGGTFENQYGQLLPYAAFALLACRSCSAPWSARRWWPASWSSAPIC
jgi:chromate transport protein ChrA